MRNSTASPSNPNRKISLSLKENNIAFITLFLDVEGTFIRLKCEVIEKAAITYRIKPTAVRLILAMSMLNSRTLVETLQNY